MTGGMRLLELGARLRAGLGAGLGAGMRALAALDWFILGNTLLWSGVILFGYRWRNLDSYIYVLLVLLQVAGMLGLWAVLRRLQIPTWALLLLQVAIILHLAGGTIFINGVRLYDISLGAGLALPAWFSQALRYDKFVHGYYGALGVAGLGAIWPQLAGARAQGVHLLLVLLTLMGLSSIVEVAEYIGTKMVHLPEVGGYDNNLQDLLANLVGGLGAALWLERGRVWAARRAWLRCGALLISLVLLAPLLFALVLAYPPNRPLMANPTDVGLVYEPVQFASHEDRVLLQGWYVEAEGAGAEGARAVVLVHGWVNDRLIHGRALPLARILADHGYSVLLFDLRGHGQSQRRPVTLGAREQGDVAGAIEFVRDRGALQVAVVGYSIGAVATLLTVAEGTQVSAVVADSAFADLSTLLMRVMREKLWMPEPLARYGLWLVALVSGSDPRSVAPVQVAERLRGLPVLFIHGGDDRVIPVDEGRRLAAAVAGSELWIVEEARHTHSYDRRPDAYSERLLRFLDQHTAGRTPVGVAQVPRKLHDTFRTQALSGPGN